MAHPDHNRHGQDLVLPGRCAVGQLLWEVMQQFLKNLNGISQYVTQQCHFWTQIQNNHMQDLEEAFAQGPHHHYPEELEGEATQCSVMDEPYNHGQSVLWGMSFRQVGGT